MSGGASERSRAKSPIGVSVGGLRAARVVALATLALAASLLAPAFASADSPVLEFVVPGGALPVGFSGLAGEVNAQMAGFDTTVHCTAGRSEGGEVTGARSAVAAYVFTGCETQGGADGGRKCKSEGAAEEEIRTGPIDAELVYISQAKHEVGMLMNPGAGTYMTFECAGEAAEAIGSFLSPVGPTDQESTVFTASLSESESLQAPDEYEGASGEKLAAIPMGRRGGGERVTTGVALQFAITTSQPLYIRAITGEEVEAKRHEEEGRAAAAALRKHQEEEAAAAKARQEQEAAAAAKRQQEEAAKRAAEEAAKKAKQKESTRPVPLIHALKRCRKIKSRHRRARCEAAARKKYGAKHKKHRHASRSRSR